MKWFGWFRKRCEDPDQWTAEEAAAFLQKTRDHDQSLAYDDGTVVEGTGVILEKPSIGEVLALRSELFAMREQVQRLKGRLAGIQIRAQRIADLAETEEGPDKTRTDMHRLRAESEHIRKQGLGE
jgi:hypothetical protein